MKIKKIISFLGIIGILSASAYAQTETPPKPGAPRVAKIPAVVEKKLPNGLTVATVQRKNVPLVTVQFLVPSGANNELLEEAGLANLTATMLTKGTKTRTATQIAEQMEFLGGSINSGAGWNNSVVSINVMSDKLDAAMAILADVVLNPKFDEKELDLLKRQTLDELTYNLKQPGFLANYVASRYSFEEHPPGGTPESIVRITRDKIIEFKTSNYQSNHAVLIFTGDITPQRAKVLAAKFFGGWRKPNADDIEKIAVMEEIAAMEENSQVPKRVAGENDVPPIIRRILVVDLPDSGQAAVNFALSINEGRTISDEKDITRTSDIFYPATVLNSVLGGGYSARLNQEIRIKRGLSYGAGSSFAWRWQQTNFGARTQTKNDSAGEVAELVLAELKKLSEATVTANELAPRKLVLTGDFGRDLETTAGLAETVASLYTFELPLTDLNSHIRRVNDVTDSQIRAFAQQNLKNGDLIIVGDYSVFKEDLAKRFPGMKVEVVKADELNLSSENLQRAK